MINNILKIMKGFIIMAILVMPSFMAPISVEAKTLGELKKELEEYEANKDANEGNQDLTEQQINDAKNEITSIRKSITKINDEMVELTEEIESLGEQIEEKDAEIKRILNFIQVAEGESAYLEYAFGAADFTDFIYRMAVAEQLSGYNKRLIDDFKALIEEDKNKKIELETKRTELEKEQEDYKAKLDLLEGKLNELKDDMVTIEEEIKMQKEIIQVYLDRGCKDDEDIKTCGRELLPVTTKFYRPLNSGYITSNFGSRCYMLHGEEVCDYHYGVDLSNSNKNQKIYSIGTGVVAGIVEKDDCGGNKVYIHHKMKDGTTYTSSYVHLASINVKKGEVVTKDTVIGMMGGNPKIQTWDRCSTGAHLHNQISYGLYLVDYDKYSTFQSKAINPRLIINYPKGTRNWFYDRISKY